MTMDTFNGRFVSLVDVYIGDRLAFVWAIIYLPGTTPSNCYGKAQFENRNIA